MTAGVAVPEVISDGELIEIEVRFDRLARHAADAAEEGKGRVSVYVEFAQTIAEDARRLVALARSSA